jgi:hypothetical protein
MAERRPREPRRTAAAGARRVEVGRLYPVARTGVANDNRMPLRRKLERLGFWLAAAAAASALIWGLL